MENDMRDVLDALGSRQDLTAGQADLAMGRLFEGALSPAQAGALLMSLRTKGETPLELAAAARAGLTHARRVTDIPRDAPILDIVGTGGDRSNSFNCSTAVSLFLAAMGHRVVKHGNRAVSSSSGSADALEGLGLPLSTMPDQVAGELAQRNFAFLFAPNYHPAFAHIAPVRRELGVRTLFNLLGPLLNPARPSHQALGVGNAECLPLMAQTLALIDPHVHALVFFGAGGFDELTPFGPAEVLRVEEGRVESAAFDPADFGYDAGDYSPDDVRVPDKKTAVATIKDVLAGRGNPAMQAMTALNLGAALALVTGRSPAACVAEAKDAVADGAARKFAHA